MTDTEHETHEHKIRSHAHALWMAEGQPQGRADEHWRLAKEAAKAERSKGEGAKLEGADPLPAKKS